MEFKVGDKVRVIEGQYDFDNRWVGCETIVTDTSECGVVYVKPVFDSQERSQNCFYPNHLELIGQPNEKLQAAFTIANQKDEIALLREKLEECRIQRDEFVKANGRLSDRTHQLERKLAFQEERARRKVRMEDRHLEMRQESYDARRLAAAAQIAAALIQKETDELDSLRRYSNDIAHHAVTHVDALLAKLDMRRPE